MPELNVGDAAPNFELPVTMDKTWKLSDNLGSKSLVLLFFPLAYSPTCHNEMCSIRDGFIEFTGLDATVAAVSVDSPFVLARWKEEIKLPFTLLSDFNKVVCKKYGSYHEELGPLKGVAKRSAFVLDKAGIIRYIWISDDPGQLPDIETIKDVLDEIK